MTRGRRHELWYKDGPYPTELQRTLAAEVRANLKAAGLRQSDVAPIVGCTAKHVSQTLSGDVVGSLGYWDRILTVSREAARGKA